MSVNGRFYKGNDASKYPLASNTEGSFLMYFLVQMLQEEFVDIFRTLFLTKSF